MSLFCREMLKYDKNCNKRAMRKWFWIKSGCEESPALNFASHHHQRWEPLLHIRKASLLVSWGRKYYSPGVKSSSCEECFSTDSDTTLLCRLVANVSDDNFQFLFCRNWNYSHPEKEPTGAKLFPCMCRRRAACSKMVPCSTCIHPPPSQNWRYAPLQWILKICTTDIPHWPCLYQPSPSFPLWQWSHHRACHDSILERFSRSMSGTEHLAVKQGGKPMLVRWIYVDVDRPRYT